MYVDRHIYFIISFVHILSITQKLIHDDCNRNNYNIYLKKYIVKF